MKSLPISAVKDSCLTFQNECECPSKRRIDNYARINGSILAIEVDENSHRSYDKHDEEIRYDELMTDHGGNMVYIRFNPDKNSEHDSEFEDRLKPLMTEIRHHIDRIRRGENKELVEIYYMYYPSKQHAGKKKNMSVDSLLCTTCNQNFANKYTLAKHIKNIHSEDHDNLEMERCISENCQFQTLYRGDLKRHIAKCSFVVADRQSEVYRKQLHSEYEAKLKAATDDSKSHVYQEVLLLREQCTQYLQTIAGLRAENSLKIIVSDSTILWKK